MIGFLIAIGGVVLFAMSGALGLWLQQRHQRQHDLRPVNRKRVERYIPPPVIPFDESLLEHVTEQQLEETPEAWHGKSIRVDEMGVGVGFEYCTCASGVAWRISDALGREHDLRGYGSYRVRAAGVWVYPPGGGRFGHMGLREGEFRIHELEVLEFTPDPPPRPPPGDPVAF